MEDPRIQVTAQDGSYSTIGKNLFQGVGQWAQGVAGRAAGAFVNKWNQWRGQKKEQIVQILSMYRQELQQQLSEAQTRHNPSAGEDMQSVIQEIQMEIKEVDGMINLQRQKVQQQTQRAAPGGNAMPAGMPAAASSSPQGWMHRVAQQGNAQPGPAASGGVWRPSDMSKEETQGMKPILPIIRSRFPMLAGVVKNPMHRTTLIKVLQELATDPQLAFRILKNVGKLSEELEQDDAQEGEQAGATAGAPTATGGAAPTATGTTAPATPAMAPGQSGATQGVTL